MTIHVPRSVMGNPRVTFSRLGYHQARNGSFERRLGQRAYPRFHVYVKFDSSRAEISLHLDQMQHTHEGARAHKGQYDSEEVQEEAKRIIQAFPEAA